MYAPTWSAIEFGVVGRIEGGSVVPCAVQIWIGAGQPAETQMWGPPTVPEPVRLIKTVVAPAAGVGLIRRVLAARLVQLDGVTLPFGHHVFRRAAIVGSRGNDGVCPEELQARVQGWPRIFFEGAFESPSSVSEWYETVDREFASGRYEYLSLADASNHLVGFPTNRSHFAGELSAALKVPVSLHAKLEGGVLSCGLELPESLAGLSHRLRYVARSDKGDRLEPLEVSRATNPGDTTVFESSAHISPGVEPAELILELDGRRVDSIRLESQALNAGEPTGEPTETLKVASKPRTSMDQLVTPTPSLVKLGARSEAARGGGNSTRKSKRGRRPRPPLTKEIEGAYTHLHDLDWLAGSALVDLPGVRERLNPMRVMPGAQALREILLEAARQVLKDIRDVPDKAGVIHFLEEYLKGKSVAQIAEELGVTRSWCSRSYRKDAFVLAGMQFIKLASAEVP